MAIERLAFGAGMLWLAACVQGSGYTSATPQSHGHSSGGGASGAGSGGASATSSSGATTGASTTSGTGSIGTTSGLTSTSGIVQGCFSYQAPLIQCPDSPIELAGTLDDAFSGATINGQTAGIHIVNLDDPSFEGPLNACGALVVCQDAGVVLNLALTATGYISTIVETIDLQRSIYFSELPLVQQSSYFALLGNLQDPSKPLLAVTIREPGNDGLCNKAGYVPALYDLDGGFIDAGALYLQGFSLASGTATNASGVAIFLNLSPTLSKVQVVVARAPGEACLPASAAAQMTGTVELLPQYFSIVPYFVVGPDAGPVADGGV